MNHHKSECSSTAYELALRDLGVVPDAIAQRLAAEGCRGVPRDPCRCPVAVYFARLGLAVNVQASDAIVGGEIVRLPPAVQRFVARFDRGDYRELLAAPSTCEREVGHDA